MASRTSPIRRKPRSDNRIQQFFDQLVPGHALGAIRGRQTHFGKRFFEDRPDAVAQVVFDAVGRPFEEFREFFQRRTGIAHDVRVPCRRAQVPQNPAVARLGQFPF